ncbi:hypothetical protein N7495_009992 [Penicillium taxi]|uniref:uncharacterized protein n=1 Tax=Penicillium taxi TaxID=168475 RepID=UPI002545580F|nr:uncharacterized protein N7495_009992 [Penicillium taxi]KAJ5885482.1 hypothetical protein N7495_009992 [Penicillium taxi]
MRRHSGATERARCETEYENAKELETFAAQKSRGLDLYDEVLEKLEEAKALVDSGDMTKEGFMANFALV